MKFIKAKCDDKVNFYPIDNKSITMSKKSMSFWCWIEHETQYNFTLDLTDDEFEGFQEEFTRFLEDDRKNVFEVTKWLK